MFKFVILAAALTFASAIPIPAVPGAVTTTHHSSHSASAHHGMGGFGYGFGASGMTGMGGMGGMGYGYPAGGALGYGGGMGMGMSGMGYGMGYPAASKQMTQVTTTAIKPSFFGYF